MAEIQDWIYVKRASDLILSILALIILLPLLAVIAFTVLMTLGSPVLFIQVRPGLRGKLFRIMKFRTMSDKRSPNGQFLPDEERLGRIGRVLRGTSLDELPELWNVLKGEMSLVGPRPLLVQYLPRYTERQRRRHEVKPGITGWAQVNGRNAISWEQKFDLDVFYVDHQSFWFDMKILIMTLLCVCRRQGITQSGHATMPEFQATESR